MNLLEVQKKFGTKAKCIKHLERVRWGKHPECPHCQNTNVTKRELTIKYHCNSCNKDFTVLYGTIFEGSKMPLQKWFMLIAVMLNARKGISAMQIHRDLGITYKTAWYSAMRVRCAMLDEAKMLEGIVEMDEVYIGGKPRKRNKFGKDGKIADNVPSLTNITTKRGRGTKKVPVVGIVERGGNVVTKQIDRLTTKELLKMLQRYVNTSNAIVMTDEYRGYSRFEDVVQHLTINHQREFANGIINTNTIEGYWSIIKNGIRGQYHVLSKKYLPFYLAEFQYKYNRRNNQSEAFNETIENAVQGEKPMVKYKPTKSVKRIVYKPKNRKKKAA